MQVPLFPLRAVLSPGLALPLHVFEQRYQVLVRHCLYWSSPFGVVLIREGREVAPRDGGEQELAIAAIGTFAEIREATRYADGRWDLLTVGVGRFAIRGVHADIEPYLVGDVEPLEDDDGPAPSDELVERIGRLFVAYLRLLQPRDGEPVEPIDVQVEVEVPDSPEDADGGPGGGPAGARGPGGGSRELAAALRIPDDPSQAPVPPGGHRAGRGDPQAGAARGMRAGGAPARSGWPAGPRRPRLLRARLGPYLVAGSELDARAN